jgi:hypothetical protein
LSLSIKTLTLPAIALPRQRKQLIKIEARRPGG